MKKLIIFLLCLSTAVQHAHAQINKQYIIPSMPNPEARKKNIEQEWTLLQSATPGLMVRDCFLFLIDALDTRYLKPEQVEWLLKLVQTRVITDTAIKENYGNIYWGWKSCPPPRSR